MKGKGKQEDMRVVTPKGRFSFPYLESPDVGRQYSDNRFKTGLFITKADFKLSGTPLAQKVLAVGQKHFGQGVSLKDFKNPFKDTDTMAPEDREKLPEAVREGHILINAKYYSRVPGDGPEVFGPDGKTLLLPKQVAAIQGGHWGRLVVRPFYYKQSGGGITLALVSVQYQKPDEPFGGVQTGADLIDEMEVTAEEMADLARLGGEEDNSTDTVSSSSVSASPGTVDDNDPLAGLIG